MIVSAPALRLGQDGVLTPRQTRPPEGTGISHCACVADARSTDTPGPMVEAMDTFFM